MTCPYESLPYSSTPRFVFYLFFFLIVPLLLISSSFLFASCHAHCWFLRRAPLCFIFFVAAQCWLLVVLVGFIFFQVSYPFRMNVLFNSLLCIHVMLFHLWEIYCFVLNERVGLLCINGLYSCNVWSASMAEAIFSSKKNTHMDSCNGFPFMGHLLLCIEWTCWFVVHQWFIFM